MFIVILPSAMNPSSETDQFCFCWSKKQTRFVSFLWFKCRWRWLAFFTDSWSQLLVFCFLMIILMKTFLPSSKFFVESKWEKNIILFYQSFFSFNHYFCNYIVILERSGIRWKLSIVWKTKNTKKFEIEFSSVLKWLKLEKVFSFSNVTTTNWKSRQRTWETWWS